MKKRNNRGFISSRRHIPLGMIALFFLLVVASLSLWQGLKAFNQYLTQRSEPEKLYELWEKEDYSELINLGNHNLSQRPMDGNILSLVGFAHFYQGINQISLEEKLRYIESSIIYLRKALLARDNQYTTQAHYILGKCYLEKGDFYADQALEHLQKALDLGYDSIDIYEYLGAAALSLKMFPESLQFFQEILEKTKSPPVYKKIGEIHIILEEWDKAEASYKKALFHSENPHLDNEIRFELAHLYQRLKNWGKAIEQYEQILDNDDNNAEVHYQLGEIHYERGELAKARAEWRRTVRISPQHKGALLRLYN